MIIVIEEGMRKEDIMTKLKEDIEDLTLVIDLDPDQEIKITIDTKGNQADLKKAKSAEVTILEIGQENPPLLVLAHPPLQDPQNQVLILIVHQVFKIKNIIINTIY